MEKLNKAHAEGRLADKLKVYTAPRVMIIDEIGYLPIDRVGANLFFQLISRRSERGSMIPTINRSVGAWGEVFGDRVSATAVLDRMLHHAVTVNIRGSSYLPGGQAPGRAGPLTRRQRISTGWGNLNGHGWGIRRPLTLVRAVAESAAAADRRPSPKGASPPRRSPALACKLTSATPDVIKGRAATLPPRSGVRHPLGQTNPPLPAGPTGSPRGLLLISMQSHPAWVPKLQSPPGNRWRLTI
jgi:hypothetical protein